MAKKKATGKKTGKSKPKKKSAAAKAELKQKRIELLTSQVEQLADCGVTLNCKFNPAKEISAWPADFLETGSYEPLLRFCGGHDVFNTEEAPSGNELPKPNCQVFMEYFADDPYPSEADEYVDVIDQVCRMTEGDLRVEVTSVEETNDELGVPVMEIKMKSGPKKRTGTYLLGLFDPQIFEDMAKLLKEAKSKRVFFYLEQEGLDRLYGCLPRPKFNQLKRLTGLPFKLV